MGEAVRVPASFTHGLTSTRGKYRLQQQTEEKIEAHTAGFLDQPRIRPHRQMLGYLLSLHLTHTALIVNDMECLPSVFCFESPMRNPSGFVRLGH